MHAYSHNRMHFSSGICSVSPRGAPVKYSTMQKGWAVFSLTLTRGDYLVHPLPCAQRNSAIIASSGTARRKRNRSTALIFLSEFSLFSQQNVGATGSSNSQTRQCKQPFHVFKVIMSSYHCHHGKPFGTQIAVLPLIL
jgi:hypothetical protein